MAIVVTIERNGEEQSHVFRHSPVRFGRNRLNDLCMPDRQVSQWHGLIKFTSKSIVYVDLGSTNGTRIDGRGKIKDAAADIDANDRIHIAQLTIRIRHATIEEVASCDDEHTELCGPPTIESQEPGPAGRTTHLDDD